VVKIRGVLFLSEHYADYRQPASPQEPIISDDYARFGLPFHNPPVGTHQFAQVKLGAVSLGIDQEALGL